jgi:hypothetical protein
MTSSTQQLWKLTPFLTGTLGKMCYGRLVLHKIIVIRTGHGNRWWRRSSRQNCLRLVFPVPKQQSKLEYLALSTFVNKLFAVHENLCFSAIAASPRQLSLRGRKWKVATTGLYDCLVMNKSNCESHGFMANIDCRNIMHSKNINFLTVRGFPNIECSMFLQSISLVQNVSVGRLGLSLYSRMPKHWAFYMAFTTGLRI